MRRMQEIRDTQARLALACVAGLMLWPAPGLSQTDVLDEAIAEQARAEAAARDSQLRIAQLDEETSLMLAEYRQVIAEGQNLRTYNQQLASQVRSQDEEIDELLRQLEEIETTSSQVMPMMQSMVETLEQFVALDLPFLLDERRARIDNLKALMVRADVTVSERYRRIVEAYGVEMEYGRTIESYRGELGNGDGVRTVDFLRLGRVTLMYQSLDGRETGYWNAANGSWVVDSGYQRAAREGLRIANQQAAPNLFVVPVPAPREDDL